jgi:predicted ArsR family transcriptional regulator
MRQSVDVDVTAGRKGVMTVHRGPHGLHRLLSALGEPTRRRAFDLVRRADRPLSRADVAAELGIGLRLAAFHLDKLVDERMLSAHYARPSDRAGGPGAGRPAKRYAATPARFDVTVPPRRYDIAARILLAAIPDDAQELVLPGAHRYGETLAHEQAELSLEELLVEVGYEPRTSADGTIELSNCPFHELAEGAREATCRMNHAFLQGITSITAPAHTAVLDPRPGHCCVRLPRRTGASSPVSQ